MARSIPSPPRAFVGDFFTSPSPWWGICQRRSAQGWGIVKNNNGFHLRTRDDRKNGVWYVKELKFYLLKSDLYESRGGTSELTLHTSYFVLHTSHFTLDTSYFVLHTSHFILHTSYFILHTSYFILHTSQFTIHTI